MLGHMSIIDVFRASPTMIVLLICSVITVGFALERLLYFRMSATNVRKFVDDLKPKIMSGHFDGAADRCQGKRSAVARVMEQALRHVHLGGSGLKQRVDTAIEVEQVEMERNLGVLGTMSNIAPLLGLFGTVIGIIRAFADIAKAGAGGSSVVAMGVSEALMTTAAGIIVAVIATVFFNAFVRKIRTRIVELEDVREELFLMLASYNNSLDRAPAAPRERAVRTPVSLSL